MAKRSPRTAGGPAKRVPISTKVLPSLKSRLESTAAAQGRTVGNEIERRLERSYKFDLPGKRGLNELEDHTLASSFIATSATLISDILNISKSRDFNEIQTREALSSALATMLHYDLWHGQKEPDDPPAIEGQSNIKVRDLPPARLGREMALAHLNWENAWRDRPVYEDALEGRVANHWTGDGSVVEVGPARGKARE